MTTPLPEYLRPVVDLVQRTYPKGLPQSDYAPLLVVLSDHLSERNLGLAMWGICGEEPVVAQNDAAAALSTNRPRRGDVMRVRALLHRSDVDRLLQEGD